MSRPLRDVVSDMLASPIAFHPVLARIAGSVTAGLMLSQALYWAKILEKTPGREDGWFHKKQAEWTKETCLTRWEQDGARKRLRECPFWGEKVEGDPSKPGCVRTFFRVDIGLLIDAICTNVEIPHVRKNHTRGVEFPQFNNTETTTTSKTTEGVSATAKPRSESLPDWIPLRTWGEFRQMRERIRRPLTEAAVDYTIRDLTELRAKGQDIQAVLEQSIQGSHAKVFEVKNGNSNRVGTAWGESAQDFAAKIARNSGLQRRSA